MQICHALDYAHGLVDTGSQLPLGIVHRDITPRNILISRTGEIKLTDFGIAKVRDRVSDQTRTGAAKGSLPYMSPEQVRCLPLNGSSDLYSLAIVLYETLVGQRLYSADSEIVLMQRVGRGGVDAATLDSPFIPPQLAAVLAKALQVEPTERYARGEEMAADLARFLAGRYDVHEELARLARDLCPGAGVAQPQTRPEAPVAAGGSQAACRPVGRDGGVSTGASNGRVRRIRAAPGPALRTAAIATIAVVGSLVAGVSLATAIMRLRPAAKALLGALAPPSAAIATTPPGATIVVDGDTLNKVTPVAPRLDGSREHGVLLVMEGYETLVDTIPASGLGGGTHRLARSMTTLVDFEAVPGGAVVVCGGDTLGETPIVATRVTATGSPVSIEFLRKGLQPVAGEFAFTPGGPRVTGRALALTEAAGSSRALWRVTADFGVGDSGGVATGHGEASPLRSTPDLVAASKWLGLDSQSVTVAVSEPRPEKKAEAQPAPVRGNTPPASESAKVKLEVRRGGKAVPYARVWAIPSGGRDGTEMKCSVTGRLEIKLAAGEHTIRATDGDITKSVSRALRPGATISITIDLDD
jgi:hypothetical protein